MQLKLYNRGGCGPEYSQVTFRSTVGYLEVFAPEVTKSCIITAQQARRLAAFLLAYSEGGPFDDSQWKNEPNLWAREG